MISPRSRPILIAILVALLCGIAIGRVSATGHAHPSAIRFAPVRIPAAPSMEPVALTPLSTAGPTSMPGLILEPAAPTQQVAPPGDLAPAPELEERPRNLSTESVGGSSSITGIASYYDWHPGEAAACAPLRAALGAGWRGRVVSVNGITVRLTDYCPQTGRVIDLDSRTFAELAPLSQGLLAVEIRW